MRPRTTPKPKTARHSLTDRILTLCLSGRFGVREAIAEATTRRRKMKGKGKRRSPVQRKTGRDRSC